MSLDSLSSSSSSHLISQVQGGEVNPQIKGKVTSSKLKTLGKIALVGAFLGAGIAITANRFGRSEIAPGLKTICTLEEGGRTWLANTPEECKMADSLFKAGHIKEAKQTMQASAASSWACAIAHGVVDMHIGSENYHMWQELDKQPWFSAYHAPHQDIFNSHNSMWKARVEAAEARFTPFPYTGINPTNLCIHELLTVQHVMDDLCKEHEYTQQNPITKYFYTPSAKCESATYTDADGSPLVFKLNERL